MAPTTVDELIVRATNVVKERKKHKIGPHVMRMMNIRQDYIQRVKKAIKQVRELALMIRPWCEIEVQNVNNEVYEQQPLQVSPSFDLVDSMLRSALEDIHTAVRIVQNETLAIPIFDLEPVVKHIDAAIYLVTAHYMQPTEPLILTRIYKICTMICDWFNKNSGFNTAQCAVA